MEALRAEGAVVECAEGATVALAVAVAEEGAETGAGAETAGVENGRLVVEAVN